MNQKRCASKWLWPILSYIKKPKQTKSDDNDTRAQTNGCSLYKLTNNPYTQHHPTQDTSVHGAGT